MLADPAFLIVDTTFFFFFFFGLLRAIPQRMEVPRLGVKSESEL